jgi:hypothetical protein
MLTCSHTKDNIAEERRSRTPLPLPDLIVSVRLRLRHRQVSMLTTQPPTTPAGPPGPEGPPARKSDNGNNTLVDMLAIFSTSIALVGVIIAIAKALVILREAGTSNCEGVEHTASFTAASPDPLLFTWHREDITPGGTSCGLLKAPISYNQHQVKNSWLAAPRAEDGLPTTKVRACISSSCQYISTISSETRARR